MTTYQFHSPTSIAAALSIEPTAGSLRAAVLEAIRGATDGLTDEEMQERLGMNPSTQRPRRVELVRGGFVEDSGRQRPTRSGRGAAVWVVKSKGQVGPLIQKDLFDGPNTPLKEAAMVALESR